MSDAGRQVPIATLADRRERLAQAVDEASFGSALVVRPEHLRYLAGVVTTGPGALLVTGRRAVLLVPAATELAVEPAAVGIELRTYLAYDTGELVDPVLAFDAALTGVLEAAPRGAIACDVGGLRGPLRSDRHADLVDAEEVLARIRRPRDGWEVDQVRARVAWLDDALSAARAVVEAGATEVEIANAASVSLAGAIGGPVVLDHNLGSGPRSALPEPRACRRRIAPGDLVLVDLYPPLDGYFADLTRTWSEGPAPDAARRLHDSVRVALRAAEERLQPGTPVAVIDRAIRDALRVAGDLDRTMAHHSGHGIGIFAWERPWIGPRSAETLEIGDIVAVEPGAYLAGIGGVRIEGNYLITPGGPERLDRVDEELVA